MNRPSRLTAGIALATAGARLLPASRTLLDLGAGLRWRLDRVDAAALTFEDGPDPRGTPRVLELLAEHRVPATFFLVGEQVRRHPGLARDIARAGHTIGFHGDLHRAELGSRPCTLRRERQHAIEAILDATGREPDLYRPPFGAPSPAGLAVDREASRRTVLWSRRGHERRLRASADSLVDDVLGGGLRGGEIILLRDSDRYGPTYGWRSTLIALPRVLAACRAQDLDLVAL